MKQNLLKLSALFIVFALIFVSCDKTETSEYTETEPNGDFANANALTIDLSYDASIDPVMDEDFFKITSTSDVTVTVTGESSLEVRVTFYDQDQIEFFADDAGTRGGT